MPATTPSNKNRKNVNFWKVALLILVLLIPIKVISDVLERKGNDALMGIFMIPLLPGFIIYVLVTGDIHGWQPGPIGQSGRIIVTILGSWIFWTPLLYWIYTRVIRRT